MKQSAIILTPEQMRINQEQAARDRAVVMAKSHARKEYLVKRGQETKRKAPKSDIQLLRIAENQAKLAAAREQTEEELDCVKHLNTLGSRAAAFTIRKQQLDEKEEREEKEKIFDERQNLIMEINRLRLQAAEEAEEKRKKVQRYQDKDVLLGQIAARAEARKLKQKQIEADARVQERMMKKLEEDELDKMRRRTERQKQNQLEVMATNERAKALKLRQKEVEAEEDARIDAYQRNKALKEEEDEKLAIARAAEKELEVAKLRAQMTKMADTQSELDELRAKRALEQKERDARTKDREIEEKRKQVLLEMGVAREHQHRQKTVAAMLERKAQEQEYFKNLATADEQRQKSIAYDQKKERERLANKEIVLAQIKDKETKRAAARGSKAMEGKAINDEFNNELSGLEKIRTAKIAKLRAQGVDEVYLTEMQRADMKKLQLR